MADRANGTRMYSVLGGMMFGSASSCDAIMRIFQPGRANARLAHNPRATDKPPPETELNASITITNPDGMNLDMMISVRALVTPSRAIRDDNSTLAEDVRRSRSIYMTDEQQGTFGRDDGRECEGCRSQKSYDQE